MNNSKWKNRKFGFKFLRYGLMLSATAFFIYYIYVISLYVSFGKSIKKALFHPSERKIERVQKRDSLLLHNHILSKDTLVFECSDGAQLKISAHHHDSIYYEFLSEDLERNKISGLAKLHPESIAYQYRQRVDLKEGNKNFKIRSFLFIHYKEGCYRSIHISKARKLKNSHAYLKSICPQDHLEQELKLHFN